MKNEIRTAITLAIILFFSISSPAQGNFVPGHIYKLDKDTIAGWICLQGNADLANGCIFRQTPKGKSYKYGLKDLSGFKFENENRVFNKRTIEYIRLNREVFLETIISGDLSLFYWLDLKTGEVLFLSKKSDSTLIPLPFEKSERSFDDGYTRRRRMVLSTMHQDTLYKYMKDRTDLLKDIENIRMPTLSNLTQLVLKYNHFSENAVNKNPNLARHPISVYITPDFSNFNFKLTSATIWDYFGGATFGMGFHGKKDILGFEVGVLKRIIRANSVYHDNLNMYRIPINLVYRFTNNWFQPFITIGVDGFYDREGIQYFFGPSAGFNIKMIDRFALSYRFGVDLRKYNYQVYEPFYAIVSYPYMTAGIQFRF